MYNTPHTEVACVINGPHVALAVRVIICANWFEQVQSKIGQVLLFICGTGRRSGGAVAAQWRRSGGAAAAQRRRSDAQWRRFTTGRAARRFSSARVAVAVAVRVTIRPHLPCQQSGSAAPVGKQQ